MWGETELKKKAVSRESEKKRALKSESRRTINPVKQKALFGTCVGSKVPLHLHVGLAVADPNKCHQED